MGGSTLGFGGTGGSGGATLGGFVRGATLGGTSMKSILGSLHGVKISWSNLSSGGSIGMGDDRGR